MRTCRSTARTRRLSTVGKAVPFCHLYMACGELKPNAICRSWTESPAAFRRLTMLAPVRARLIVGISISLYLLPNYLPKLGMKKPLVTLKTSGFNNSERKIQEDLSVRSTGAQSNHILLLILKRACFAEAIFLILEDSLPLAHIEDSGRNGLHDAFSFLQSSCSRVLSVL